MFSLVFNTPDHCAETLHSGNMIVVCPDLEGLVRTVPLWLCLSPKLDHPGSGVSDLKPPYIVNSSVQTTDLDVWPKPRGSSYVFGVNARKGPCAC